jgi:ABC-type phosphate/phosphonate transport system substrate-binding protein
MNVDQARIQELVARLTESLNVEVNATAGPQDQAVVTVLSPARADVAEFLSKDTTAVARFHNTQQLTALSQYAAARLGCLALGPLRMQPMEVVADHQRR